MPSRKGEVEDLEDLPQQGRVLDRGVWKEFKVKRVVLVPLSRGTSRCPSSLPLHSSVSSVGK